MKLRSYRNRNGNKPLKVQVAETITQTISSGDFSPGVFLPTEQNLMKEFSVSRNTVRGALQILQSDGLIRSRKSMGWEILPRESTRITKPVALIDTLRSVPAFFQPNLMQTAKPLKLEFQIFPVDSKTLSEHQLSEIMDLEKFSGLLYAMGVRVPDAHLSEARKHGLPIVCAGLESQELYDTVANDSRDGMRKIFDHFRQTGRKRILFLGCSLADPSFALRQSLFFELAEEYAFQANDLILDANTLCGASRELLLNRVDTFSPDAIIGVTEAISFGPCVVLQRKGYRIPREIEVVGFHSAEVAGNFAAAGIESISSLGYSWSKICSVALDCMRRRLDGNVAPPRFIPIPGTLRGAALTQSQMKGGHP